MSRKTILAAVVVVVVAFFACLLLTRDGDHGGASERVEDQARSVANVEEDGRATSPAGEAGEDVGSQVPETERLTPAPSSEQARISGGTVFSGRVVDVATGEPVKAYTLSLRQLRRSDGSRVQPLASWRREPVESPDGAFSVLLGEGGTYFFGCAALGYQRYKPQEIDIPHGEGLSGYLIELKPGLTITGRVVADATSEPLGGAEVLSSLMTRAQTIRDGDPTVTNAGGAFTVTGLKEGPHRVWARHPDFAEGHADAEAGAEGLEIRLRPGYRFFGEVRDAEGRFQAGAKVNFYTSDISEGRSVETAPDGRYLSPQLPPSGYVLSVGSGQDEAEGGYLREMQHADLVDRDVEVSFGMVPGKAAWRGTLFDGDGASVPGAVIDLQARSIRVSGEKPDGKRPRTSRCTTMTDERGAFHIVGMDPAPYDVNVKLPENTLSTTYFKVDEVDFDAPGLVERDLHLRRTELSGTVIDERTGLPWRGDWGFVMASSGLGRILTTSVDGEGRFRFRGLPPDTYLLAANVAEAARGHLRDVVLEDGAVIDDLRIVLPSSGTLDLRVTGLAEIRNQALRVSVRSTTDDRGWTVGNTQGGGCAVDNDGVCTLNTKCEPGSWKLTLAHDAIGTAERTFTIAAGETTRVEVDRSEFRK